MPGLLPLLLAEGRWGKAPPGFLVEKGWEEAAGQGRGAPGARPPLSEGLRAPCGEFLPLTCQPQGFCGVGNAAELRLSALLHGTFRCLPGRV